MHSEIFIFIALFAFLSFLVFLFFTTRHKERMALIESGQDAGLFKSVPKEHSALKWGLVLLFLGAASGFGIYLDIAMNNDGPLATLPLSIAGGGAGLLTYYFLIKNENDD